MINKWSVLAFAFALVSGCGPKDKSDALAEAGDRVLTREDFRKMTGVAFDSLAKDQSWPILAEWVDQAMVDQEAAAAKLRDDPTLAAKEREIDTQFYRAVLLARQPVPEITDSLITSYYNEHQIEFKRPTDSYMIESFYCESEDSLKAFRRALEKADTANLKSGFVIWEGKWLADASELEPPLLAGIRAIQPGGLSPIMPFGEGFHLVRLHDVYPQGAQLNLDAVRGEIRERLLTEQSQRRQERWDTELRSRYQPKIMGDPK